MYEMTQKELDSCCLWTKICYQLVQKRRPVPNNIYKKARTLEPYYFHDQMNYEIYYRGRTFRKFSTPKKRVFS